MSSLSGGLCPRGSPSVGICVWGGLCPGGSLSREGSPSGEVCRGGVSVRGVSVQGDLCPGGLPDRDPPPSEQNDRQTGVKTLPCHNFIVGGNYHKVVPAVEWILNGSVRGRVSSSR